MHGACTVPRNSCIFWKTEKNSPLLPIGWRSTWDEKMIIEYHVRRFLTGTVVLLHCLWKLYVLQHHKHNTSSSPVCNVQVDMVQLLYRCSTCNICALLLVAHWSTTFSKYLSYMLYSRSKLAKRDIGCALYQVLASCTRTRCTSKYSTVSQSPADCCFTWYGVWYCNLYDLLKSWLSRLR